MKKSLRQIVAIVMAVVCAPLLWIFVEYGFVFSRIVLPALWGGVLERPDFRENTGDVTISRLADPQLFWFNVEIYALLSVICWLVVISVVWVLYSQLKRSFTKQAL